MKKILLTAFLAAAGFALFADEAAAQTAAAAAKGPTAAEAMFTVNNIWMLIGTFLVFTMHLGFALLETGLTRAKNCVTILGSRKTVREMIENNYQNRRYTGLTDRIREQCRI